MFYCVHIKKTCPYTCLCLNSNIYIIYSIFCLIVKKKILNVKDGIIRVYIKFVPLCYPIKMTMSKDHVITYTVLLFIYLFISNISCR